MDEPVTVSIIIPTFKRQTGLMRLLRSIAESAYPPESLEIIIVDNGGDVASQDCIAILEESALELVKPKRNLYCSGGRQLGANIATGKYLLFIDDDNILEVNCITRLVSGLDSDASLGMVGPLMLWYKDKKKVWAAGARVTRLGLSRHLLADKYIDKVEYPDIITGIDYFPNMFMVRKEILINVPFDVVALPHNWSEPDFGLRLIEYGYSAATITGALEWHDINYAGLTTRTNREHIYDQAKSRLVFRNRHRSRLRDWIMFWALVFPVSTIVYLIQILVSPRDKIQMLSAYIVGTLDGITQKGRGSRQ